MKVSWIASAAFLAATHASPLQQASRAPRTHGLHSEYSVEGTDGRLQFWLKDHKGHTKQHSVASSSFEQTIHFYPPAHYLNNGTNDALDERNLGDVCAAVATCAGNAWESTMDFGSAAIAATKYGCGAVGDAMYTFLTDDDYAQARQALGGYAVDFGIGFATNVLGAVPAYYINARLSAANDDGAQSNDACGENDPSTYAGNASNAVYQFCLAIQSQVQQENYQPGLLTSDYDTLTSTTAVTTTSGPPSPDGREGLARFFLANQAGSMGAVCNDYGVSWRRLLRAL